MFSISYIAISYYWKQLYYNSHLSCEDKVYLKGLSEHVGAAEFFKGQKISLYKIFMYSPEIVQKLILKVIKKLGLPLP
jgi:hypothetical protein